VDDEHLSAAFVLRTGAKRLSNDDLERWRLSSG